MTYQEMYNKVKNDFQKNDKTKKRFNHIEEVIKMATLLNEQNHFGINQEKLCIAALLHDYGKLYNKEEMIECLTKYLSNEEILKIKPYEGVIHAYLSYYLAQDLFKIEDNDVLIAIKYHTTGCPDMSTLAKVVYVADAIEVTRTYPGVQKLRDEVLKDFDNGFILIIKTTIDKLIKFNEPIEINTLSTYEYYRKDCAYKNKH